jgi:hypothetical protein
MALNIAWCGGIFCHVSKDKKMKMDEQKIGWKLKWIKG